MTESPTGPEIEIDIIKNEEIVGNALSKISHNKAVVKRVQTAVLSRINANGNPADQDMPFVKSLIRFAHRQEPSDQKREKEVDTHDEGDIQLRPYQVRAVSFSDERLFLNNQSVGIEMPTGMGKTPIAFELIHRAVFGNYLRYKEKVVSIKKHYNHVIFSAPTNTLAHQQYEAFRKYMSSSNLNLDHVQLVADTDEPLRVNDPEHGRIWFCTHHKHGSLQLPSEGSVLHIIDESHVGSKSHPGHYPTFELFGNEEQDDLPPTVLLTATMTQEKTTYPHFGIASDAVFRAGTLEELKPRSFFTPDKIGATWNRCFLYVHGLIADLLHDRLVHHSTDKETRKKLMRTANAGEFSKQLTQPRPVQMDFDEKEWGTKNWAGIPATRRVYSYRRDFLKYGYPALRQKLEDDLHLIQHENSGELIECEHCGEILDSLKLKGEHRSNYVGCLRYMQDEIKHMHGVVSTIMGYMDRPLCQKTSAQLYHDIATKHGHIIDQSQIIDESSFVSEQMERFRLGPEVPLDEGDALFPKWRQTLRTLQALKERGKTPALLHIENKDAMYALEQFLEENGHRCLSIWSGKRKQDVFVVEDAHQQVVNNEVDVVLTTSVAKMGLNIDGLRGLILYDYQNIEDILQFSGRIMRYSGEEGYVYLLGCDRDAKTSEPGSILGNEIYRARSLVKKLQKHMKRHGTRAANLEGKGDVTGQNNHRKKFDPPDMQTQFDFFEPQ